MRIGTEVSFTRRNGQKAKGRVSGAKWAGKKGEWIPVNTGDKKNPQITQMRPSQLTKV